MKPTSMVSLVTEYLALRRGMGFDLKTSGCLLLSFARFADATTPHASITIDLARRWAAATKSGPAQVSQRLSVVRQFALYRAALDPSTEVPPAELLCRPARWNPPHIYSDTEIAELLRAAAALRPRGGLRPRTYVALFSLLASTGLRISEARRLTKWDVDLDKSLLVVRESKFRKCRLVPLHPTAVLPLERYGVVRDGYAHALRSEFFFRTDNIAALKTRAVQGTFARLRDRLGWTADGRARLPRIHDLRHTFAVRRLLHWYEEGAPIDSRMLALSTYLGHAKVSDTYWYLSAVPELLAVASGRFEHFAQREEERA